MHSLLTSKCSRVRNEPQRTAHCSPPNRTLLVNNFSASVKLDLHEVFAVHPRHGSHALFPSARGLSRVERVLRRSFSALTSALPMRSGCATGLALTIYRGSTMLCYGTS
jgi:hypothetical protein